MFDATLIPTDPTMHAVLHTRYGDASRLAAATSPRPMPRRGEVRVRVHASSINYGDHVMMTGRPWLARLALGLFRPRQPVLGMDLAGVVDAVGPDVEDLAIGDAVFGVGRGAFAQYACARASQLARLPAGVDFEQAAAAPTAGATALQGLRDRGRVGPGSKVLIIGASGGVGTFAVQIGRALGATVTAVCSTRNVDQARALGAAEVVDYTRADFTRLITRFDAILDLAGSAPLGACLRLLAPGGTFVSSVGRLGRTLRAALAALRAPRRVAVLVARSDRASFEALGALLAAGDVAPALERTCTLDEVPAALARQGEGHARGKTVVRVA